MQHKYACYNNADDFFCVKIMVSMETKFIITDKFILVLSTDMRRLTAAIRSEKCVVRRFRRRANVYLHKPR